MHNSISEAKASTENLQLNQDPNHPHHHHDGECCDHDHSHHHQHYEPYRKDHKIGRNDPCFCGSEKKYKKCCIDE